MERPPRLASIVDLPDGSLLLRPDPRRARSLRSTLLAICAVDVALAAALFIAGSLVPALGALRIASVLALVAAAGVFWLGRRFVPRGVKADTSAVTYLGMTDRSMPRADLAVIFRGLIFVSSRGGGGWERSYVFSGGDGKVAFSCLAVWFPEESIAELARRLDVPLRGDFSVRVKDRVELRTE